MELRQNRCSWLRTLAFWRWRTDPSPPSGASQHPTWLARAATCEQPLLRRVRRGSICPAGSRIPAPVVAAFLCCELHGVVLEGPSLGVEIFGAYHEPCHKQASRKKKKCACKSKNGDLILDVKVVQENSHRPSRAALCSSRKKYTPFQLKHRAAAASCSCANAAVEDGP